MAKKNSSKTATQEAIQKAEPRVINFRGWQGVNFAEAPLTWEPLETAVGKHRQLDLANTFLMVQNNLVTTNTKALETRPDSIFIGSAPSISVTTGTASSHTTRTIAAKLTGVACVFKNYIFAAARVSDRDVIIYRALNSTNQWGIIDVVSSTDAIDVVNITNAHITSYFYIYEMNVFEGFLLVSGINRSNNKSELLVAKVSIGSSISIQGYNQRDNVYDRANYVCGVAEVTNPTTSTFRIGAVGMKAYTEEAHQAEESQHADDWDWVDPTPTRIQVCRAYTTIFGSTLAGPDADNPNYETLYVEYSPALWNKKRYMRITSGTSSSVTYDANITRSSAINGVDFYARENENTDWVFIGHVSKFAVLDANANDLKFTWSYNWYGAMTNINSWKSSSLMLPEENTTKSTEAKHFACHDSRLYFWGDASKPYRLWIGGNPGNELSVSRGLGGAWIDIEAGSGFDIKGTAKWKTQGGANIVTIMCGSDNTGRVKRFNLVETNLTVSNEIGYKSYMYEEVSNVTGCNSRYGYGVFADGLYNLSRYGLMLTTMASEYNAQMKNEKVSEPISPIFTERLGNRLKDGRLLCIDGTIYIVLSEDNGHPSTPTKLDNVILCYDIDTKAWFTFTHDETLNANMGADSDHILGLIEIDSDQYTEGLGVITENQIRLYPTSGIQAATVPAFQVLMETGELIPRIPEQAFWYIQQLEFRFDYLISNPNDPPIILIEGVDYYGRQFKIEKKINFKGRTYQTLPNNDNGVTGEQRNYTEWIRVDKMVESLRVRLKGKARFKLTHINARCYQQPDTIGTPYGFDARDTYRDRHGNEHVIHHYINDYNNLRRAIVS